MQKGSVRVLVVGQTPPPYGGQAIMIQRLLQLPLPGVQFEHVRMAFSKDMEDLKRVRAGKLLHAAKVIFGIYRARLLRGADVLYYPPSGPELVPVLRDMAILLATRWLFRATVFHFHAAGLSEIYPRLAWPLRLCFRGAFGKPELAIHLSEYNPDDGRFLRARRVAVVPNGVIDEATPAAPDEGMRPAAAGPANILFVGLIDDTKGIFVLLEALALLGRAGQHPSVTVVGRFASTTVESRVRKLVADAGLGAQVEFPGVLTGRAKLERFAAADVFCLPTYFESESFSLVTVEAMSFSLPVVVSRWRGLQSVVTDGVNGYLTEPRDAHALADRLGALLADATLRRALGTAGRRMFEERYSMAGFGKAMQACLASV